MDHKPSVVVGVPCDSNGSDPPGDAVVPERKMTPNERRAARSRRQDLERAVNIQKRHPDFPAAQVRILERTKELQAGLTEGQIRWYTPDRMEAVLRLLDIRAAAYLQLVTDMESQEAFMTVLSELCRHAWLEFTGHPIEVLQPLPGDRQLNILNERVGHWLGEGYKRLMPSATGPGLGEDAATASFGRHDRAPQGGQLAASTDDGQDERLTLQILRPE